MVGGLWFRADRGEGLFKIDKAVIILLEEDSGVEDVDEVCEALAEAAAVTSDKLRPKKGGLSAFRAALSKHEKPTEVMVESYLRGLESDERALVWEALDDISERYPNMSDFEKKMMALDSATFYKVAYLKNETLDEVLNYGVAEMMDRGDVEKKARWIEMKMKVIDAFEKSKAISYHHIEKTKEISQRENPINMILNDPDIEEIRLEVRRRGKTYIVEEDNVQEAEYTIEDE